MADFPVVSFTRVPAPDLHRLHVFRPHLGRWDFEPYGICIRHHWLQQHGVRPVQYGSEELWESLAEFERPYFQLHVPSDERNPATQWSFEREWRHLGDVELDQLPRDAALVFVPTEQEARELTRTSRWPVSVVPTEPRKAI